MTFTSAERAWLAALADAGFTHPHPASFHWSSLANPAGDHAAAEAAFRRLLETDPDHAAGLEGLAYLLQKSGRHTEALECRRRLRTAEARALAIDEASVDEVADYLLARDGTTDAPDRVPIEYLRVRFDEYARTYDEHLTDTLSYDGPAVVMRALAPLVGDDRHDVLDAGCGTGLAGASLRTLAHRLDGVDLSSEMLTRARATGHYDELTAGDMIATMMERAGRYSLVVAIEVLIYVGDLAPVFRAVRACLVPGGLFAFTVERASDRDVQLSADGRYRHGETYVRRVCEESFDVLSLEATSVRKQHGQAVDALVSVARVRAPSA